MSLIFNKLSRLVITFLPRSKHLLISWLQSPSAVILEPKKIKSVTVSIFSPSICHEVMRLNAMIFAFLMLSFKPTFSLSFFSFIKRLFSSSSLSAKGWCHLRIWGCWYFTYSVQFSCSVVSNSLRPRESQHARPPCASLLGPAPVDPGWFKGGGMASAPLEKYIFNYRYRERLETDSVVGDSVEKEAE